MGLIKWMQGLGDSAGVKAVEDSVFAFGPCLKLITAKEAQPVSQHYGRHEDQSDMAPFSFITVLPIKQ